MDDNSAREREIPSPNELDDLLKKGELNRLGGGSRRECFELKGGKLCLKCYRDESTAKSSTVAGEIRKYRHDERKNTCRQEFRYYEKLKLSLPAEVFAVFPEVCLSFHLPMKGWALVENVLRNADGSVPRSFRDEFFAADEARRAKLLSAFDRVIENFVKYGVRFYDTQNLLVQTLAEGGFRLRVVDFEPAARTLIPIDSIFPALVRAKVRRRAKRYLERQLLLK